MFLYLRNRLGKIAELELLALIVPELQCDLTGCNKLIKQGFSIVLDEDDSVSGVYAKTSSGNYTLDTSSGFEKDRPFMSSKHIGSWTATQFGKSNYCIASSKQFEIPFALQRDWNIGLICRWRK